jgi:four helix bundle protein
MGSAVELEYFLLLCRDVGMIDGAYEGLNSHTRRVQRMLASLIRKVEAGRTKS